MAWREAGGKEVESGVKLCQRERETEAEKGTEEGTDIREERGRRRNLKCQ
jgi:hypothetical protein